jgi:hypothetical protein
MGDQGLWVVDYVVDHVGDADAEVEQRIALGVVGEEVVVDRVAAARRAGEQHAAAVAALFVAGVVEGFGEQAPLHGDVLRVVGGVEQLVDRPAERGVVDDQPAGARAEAQRVEAAGRRARRPRSHPEETQDHVVGADDQRRLGVVRVVAQRNAAAGRGLAGDGQVGLGDLDRRAERDRAAEPEHHRPRAARGQRRAQRAGAAVVEVGDRQHLAASSAAGGGAEAGG